jgi:D-alanyl-D-alanine carboxypeptidase
VKTLTVKPGAAVQTASVGALSLPTLPIVEPPARSETPAAAAKPETAAPSPVSAVTGSIPETAPSPPAPAAAAVPATPAANPAPVHSGWLIQVGAFTVEQEAKQRLASVQSKASRMLASAAAFTESVLKGETTYYRARFAMLGKEQAEAACKYLKRNDVDCMTIKN